MNAINEWMAAFIALFILLMVRVFFFTPAQNRRPLRRPEIPPPPPPPPPKPATFPFLTGAAYPEGARCPVMRLAEGKASDWETFVATNSTNAYSRGVVDYCLRWSEAMESELDGGAVLEEIAERTSLEQAQGITGFMYGCAVGVLAHVWFRGEDLRRWHNLKTQMGTEGERANEKGTVLNPALLCFGTPNDAP